MIDHDPAPDAIAADIAVETEHPRPSPLWIVDLNNAVRELAVSLDEEGTWAEIDAEVRAGLVQIRAICEAGIERIDADRGQAGDG